MDLSLERALKILETPTAAAPETVEFRESRIKSCRLIAAHLCNLALRANTDFAAQLSRGIAALLHTCGDKDMSVWTVADETLNKVIKTLIASFQDRVLIALYKGIKGDELIQQTLSDSMDKLCCTLVYYLREKEVNNIIELLVRNLADVSGAIRRASAASIVVICRHYPKSPFDFAIYTIRKQLQSYIIPATKPDHQVSTPVGSPKVARAAPAITSPRKDSAVQNRAMSFMDDKDNKDDDDINMDEEEKDGADNSRKEHEKEDEKASNEVKQPISEANLYGILYCLLQLLNLSEEWKSRVVDPRNPILPHVPFLHDLASKCMVHYDQNVMGIALELLQAILAASHSPSRNAVLNSQLVSPTTVPEILGRLTWILNRKPPVRVASRAVVLQCLSFLALHYTQTFCDYFRLTDGAEAATAVDDLSKGDAAAAPADEAEAAADNGGSGVAQTTYAQNQHTMKELLQLVTFSDPLIRGSLAHIIACFIAGILRNPHTTATPAQATAATSPGAEESVPVPVLALEVIDVQSLIVDYLLRLLLDESANVRKMVCRALITCFDDILASAYARCAITILYTLIDSIREDTYWLVKTEALAFVASVDYCALQVVERDLATENRVFVYTREETSFQRRCLNMVLDLLASPDARVRQAAAEAVVTLVERLQLYSPAGPTHPYAALIERHIRHLCTVHSIKKFAIRRDVLHNLSQVAQLLLERVNALVPEDGVRGIYHALLLLCKAYAKPHTYLTHAHTEGMKNFDALPNPMAIYFGDFVPLIVERLTSSWAATDLDVHIDLVQIIGYMCKKSERHHLTSQWLRILQHLLAVITLLSHIAQRKPAPQSRPETASGFAMIADLAASPATKGAVLGTAATQGVYTELYEKLHSTFSTSLISFEQDKFSLLRKSCFKAMAMLIRNVGRYVVPFAQEILNHLNVHFFLSPKEVMSCLLELFMVTFHPVQPSKAQVQRVFHDANYKSHQAIVHPHNLGVYEQLYQGFDEEAAMAASLQDASKVPSLRPSLLSHPYRLRETQSEDFYSKVDLPIPLIEADKIIRSGKSLIRMFEPLVIGAMKLYRDTHDLGLQKQVLFVMTQLIKFGIDFSRLDKDQSFLGHVINQIMGKKSYLPHPPHILPYIFDFLSVLAIIRKHLPGLAVLGELWHVAAHYRQTTTKWTEEDCEKELTELREEFLARILKRANLSHGIGLLSIILFKSRYRVEECKGYALKIGQTLFPLLASASLAANIATNDYELLELYALFDKVVEKHSESEKTKKETTDSLCEGFVQLSIKSVTGPYWLPPALVYLRFLGMRSEEEILPALAKLDDDPASSSPGEDVFVRRMMELVLIALQDTMKREHASAFSVELYAHLVTHLIALASPARFPRIHAAMRGLWTDAATDFAHARLFPLLFSGPLAYGREVACLSLAMLKFARSSRTAAGRGKLGWRARVVELTALVGYLATFLDASASHAWSGLTWSEDLGQLLIEHTNEPTVKKFVALVGSALSSPSMYATASGRFAFQLLGSLRSRLLGSGSAAGRQEQDFKNLLAALGSLPPSMATVGVLLRVLKRRGRSLFAERLLLAQLTSEISYVLSSTRIYFILQGIDGQPQREAKLRRQVTKARRRFDALGFPETAPLTVAFGRFVAAALELLPSGDSDNAADADADVTIGFSARQQRERDNTADVRQRLHGDNWKQLIVEFAMERCTAAVNGEAGEADVATADHLASGLKAIYYADKPAFLALLRRTTPKLQSTHSDADGAEEEPACDLGLLAHLVLTSKPIMRDASVRKAVIALITAHIKSVIAADAADAPEPAWHDFVQVVRSVVCVLQCDGRPSRSVVAAAMSSSSSATSAATGPAGTSSPNGSSASLLTSSSAALLAHVASLSEALYQHLTELDMPRPPPPGKTAASEDDLVVVLKCTELVIAISQRETLTEWQSDDEKATWEHMFASILQVQELISGKSVSVAADEEWHDGERRRAEIKMERVMELLLSEADNKRFAYLHDTCADNPVVNAYCDLVTALARKDVQLIYPQIVEGAYLEYDLLQNINNMHDSSRQKFDENPEKILAITLRLLNAVTWDHNSQFTKLWANLLAMFDVNKVNEEWCSLKTQSLLARSLTSLLMRSCLGIATLPETTTSPTPLSGWYYWRSVGTMAWDAYSLVHVPRERELIYLNSENGRTLVSLQSALAAAVSKLHSPSAASLDSWQFPTPPSANTALQSSSLVQLSPYHQNIERIGWPSLRYYAGQVSVHELRQNRQYKWQGIDMTNLVDVLLRSFEKRLASEPGSMMAAEAMRGILILSDLFRTDQWRWMCQLFIRMLEEDQVDDQVQHYYLLAGIARALAVSERDCLGLVTPMWVTNTFRHALESAHQSARLAALNALLTLIEGNLTRVLLPLLPYFFKTILAALCEEGGGQWLGTAREQAHLIGVAFLLIEQYPKESEEQDFTRRALAQMIKTGENSDDKMMLSAIFRGFDRLLISFSLSHTHRKRLAKFAMSKIHSFVGQGDGELFLYSLGLMLTVMYTERDSKPSKPHPATSPTDRESRNEVRNIERVTILFSKLPSSSSFETQAVIKVLPRVLVDFFRVEQALTLVIGEFVKAVAKGAPSPVTHVLYKGHKQTLAQWILICAPNFTNIRQVTRSTWGLACLFLPLASERALRALFADVARMGYVPMDLFLLIAFHFFTLLIAEEPFPSLLHVCGAEVKRLRSLSSDDDADADAEPTSADRSAANLSPRRALSTSALPPVQSLNDLGSEERDLHHSHHSHSGRRRGASPPLPKDRLSEKRIRERFYARMRRGGPDAGSSGSGSEGEVSPQLPYDHHRSSRREKSYDEAALQRIKHLADRQDAEARGDADGAGGDGSNERRRELSFDEAAQGRRRLVAEEEKEARSSPSVRRQLLPTTATGSLTPNKPKKKRRASQSKKDKTSSSSSSSSAGDDDVDGRREKAEEEDEEKQRPKEEDTDDHHNHHNHNDASA
ncbi:HEAT repeat domain containing protein [Acanthamoeba castellanii str. Neff]|uniref:HEAT repeat domain containing protein n=1 Tax=Acanthamoeba castellanii (strain ATCC 30010 / Neff) TaxID=1257118 RepID=L8GM96_ACACF|nr:HEAT repeat domain containing protein [Acanthamoeba castellanii str. Neff]ELR14180.1 HEAT repeat domain containing protein [Acanthamoeba castellanii str. Neff]